MNDNVIYTHGEAACIVKLSEDVLDGHGIKVPSPEYNERKPDNEAKLYGSVYCPRWLGENGRTFCAGNDGAVSSVAVLCVLT